MDGVVVMLFVLLGGWKGDGRRNESKVELLWFLDLLL